MPEDELDEAPKRRGGVTGIRMPDELLPRLEWACDAIKTKRNTLVVAAIEAIVEIIERQGGKLALPVDLRLADIVQVSNVVVTSPAYRDEKVVEFPAGMIPVPRRGKVPAGDPLDGIEEDEKFDLVHERLAQRISYTLELEGRSMDNARPVPLLPGKIYGFAAPDKQPARDRSIVQALKGDEVTVKRLRIPDKGEPYLIGESTDARFNVEMRGDFVIQGVLVGEV